MKKFHMKFSTYFSTAFATQLRKSSPEYPFSPILGYLSTCNTNTGYESIDLNQKVAHANTKTFDHTHGVAYAKQSP
jgi:hypothetical protein